MKQSMKYRVNRNVSLPLNREPSFLSSRYNVARVDLSPSFAFHAIRPIRIANAITKASIVQLTCTYRLHVTVDDWHGFSRVSRRRYFRKSYRSHSIVRLLSLKILISLFRSLIRRQVKCTQAHYYSQEDLQEDAV